MIFPTLWKIILKFNLTAKRTYLATSDDKDYVGFKSVTKDRELTKYIRR